MHTTAAAEISCVKVGVYHRPHTKPRVPHICLLLANVGSNSFHPCSALLLFLRGWTGGPFKPSFGLSGAVAVAQIYAAADAIHPCSAFRRVPHICPLLANVGKQLHPSLQRLAFVLTAAIPRPPESPPRSPIRNLPWPETAPRPQCRWPCLPVRGASGSRPAPRTPWQRRPSH